jgi:hypothetical protein
MAFVVLYDACVLYPAPLRDLLAVLEALRAGQFSNGDRQVFKPIVENLLDSDPLRRRAVAANTKDTNPSAALRGPATGDLFGRS